MMGWMRIAFCVGLAWVIAGCQEETVAPAPAPAPPAVAPQPPPVTAAIAVIRPTNGNTCSGTVKFTAVDGGVKVVADVTGLSAGKHGFHIHEWGDVTDVDKGLATGGHYDPEGTHHHELVDADHPDGMPHHAGDMGNLVADDSGEAHLELVLQGVTLMGPKDPIVGRAVIVHEKPDNGDQPTGGAGARIGQGVIGIAKPE
jgi:superoxide dismutase, Cu-Zn family